MRLGKHSHPHACFHYILRGGYAESTRKSSQVVPRRNALLKPPHLAHWNCFSHESHSLRIEFTEEVLSTYAVSIPNRVVFLAGPQIDQICTAILAELACGDDCSALAVQGLCIELLATCLRSRSTTAPSDYLVRCEEFLRAHHRDRLRFDHIAEQLEVSRTHLATTFRRHFGCTMGEFVRRRRVEYVKDQLSSTSISITEIALAAGFSDQSHCTRVFRSTVGASPHEWRFHHRPDMRSNTPTSVQD